MADIREQLLAAFALEHREHQTAIREAFARARQGEHIDVREVFRRAHSLKGAARAVDRPQVEAAAHALETLFAPAMEAVRQLAGEEIAQALAKLDEIERAVNPPKAQAANGDDAKSSPDAAGAYLRVDAERVSRLAATVHELSAEIDASAHQSDISAALAKDAQALSRALDQALQNPARAAQSLARLAPLARVLARSASASSRAQAERTWSAERLSAQLRDEVAAIAMVSADTVFGGLGPMLQDMGKEQGLEAELNVSGLNTQADRALLQSLRDPVIQLLRNALAHGRQSPEQRKHQGKPDALQVYLTLSAKAGRLELIVADDGRGPDWKKIEANAKQRGLIGVHQTDEVSEDALASFVFEPGFTTTDNVEAIAGRGMGLSVVAEAVRKAGGAVHMRARRPHGTEFILSTPLTAARQSLLLMQDAGARFGLPAYAVECVVDVKPGAFSVIGGRQTLQLSQDGNQILVPIIPLNRVTGLPGRASGDVNVAVAILRQGETRLGLMAEAAEDVREATLVNFEAGYLPEINLGATQLEDGESAPVLDPEIIFQRFLRHDLDLSADPSRTQTHERARKRVILVVDDSVTTRTLEKSILESQGYKVVLAVDGLDALEVLKRDIAEIDLIVADVEMPRLDGFGVLEALKRDANLARLPVIMMTSRASETDVARGLELGADAYLVKQSFDQRELLATIRQLL